MTTDPKTQRQFIHDVTNPTLTAFLPSPATATGTGIIVVPGGGWGLISWNIEGTNAAQWLADHGVAAFVLKYRILPSPTGPPAPFVVRDVGDFGPNCGGGDPKLMGMAGRPYACEDLTQAVKLLRQRAGEFGIAKDRIGLLGFSAGAFATMGIVMKHDAESRPDFAAPAYGGSTDGAPVPADAPPLFILAANDDPLISPSRYGARLYSQWRDAGKPAEIHIYAKGGHGFGVQKTGRPVDNWVQVFYEWLGDQGFWKKTRPAAATQ
jgi:acetyl esterase/lipase